MQFNLEIHRNQYSIRAYGPGTVTVALPPDDRAPAALDAIGPDAARLRQEILTRSAIITPARLLRDWAPQSFKELTPAHLELVVELAPEIVLLGTGAVLHWPAAPVSAALSEAGIGFEVMTTAAACRTYNILLGDGRRVAAALMMI